MMETRNWNGRKTLVFMLNFRYARTETDSQMTSEVVCQSLILTVKCLCQSICGLNAFALHRNRD